ncbi:MAG TPA: SDR family oxidoreductase [Solirubrobacteraceae bacterium]|nr:SDR family oxidoreductase [Solirubrobacteraceae bacterium]
MDRDRLVSLFGLEGRVALVTGARQGIGRALALGLARAGAHVATTARDAASLSDLARELDELGSEHAELGLELRDPASIDAAVAAVVERWGRLDVLVNNAGVPLRKDALETTVEEWDEVLETNLRGAFLMSRAAAHAMAGSGGRIVNVSSTFARAPVASRSAYAASKAALEQLTRVLALEWASLGITVNAVAPTTIVTESRRDLFADPAARDARVREIPLGRLGDAEDLVGAVLLLAGDAGRFMTGTTIAVDGGYSVGRGAGG